MYLVAVRFGIMENGKAYRLVDGSTVRRKNQSVRWDQKNRIDEVGIEQIE